MLPFLSFDGLVVTAVCNLEPGFCLLYEATPFLFKPPLGFLPSLRCHAGVTLPPFLYDSREAFLLLTGISDAQTSTQVFFIYLFGSDINSSNIEGKFKSSSSGICR